jgi:hypothetical protein
MDARPEECPSHREAEEHDNKLIKRFRFFVRHLLPSKVNGWLSGAIFKPTAGPAERLAVDQWRPVCANILIVWV